MLDEILAFWQFIWAYLVPVVLTVGLGGLAVYLIIILPRTTDGWWARSEMIGFGLVLASLTKWFLQLLFEFRSMGVNPEEAFPMMDTLLAIAVVSVILWIANVCRTSGLPYIVIGGVYALIAVFGV